MTKALCLLCAGALALTAAGCSKSGASSSAASSEAVSVYGSASDYDYQNFAYSDGLDENGYWSGIKALDYVTLPEDYAAIPLKKADIEPTEEDIQSQIDSVLSQNTTTRQVTDRAAADGDTVNIDYAGTVDGVAFTGGTYSGYSLTLGSGSFIDGFEDQIVGHKPGETFDVNVTFPDGYSDSTDAEGNAEDVAICAPACALSLDENNTTQRPYAVCDLVASKTGYRTVRIQGVQVFPGQVTLAQPEMIPDTEEMRDTPNVPIVIPPHSLFTGDGGSGPNPFLSCMPRVLDRVIIPKNITVHLGRPAASARNVTVSFRSYIANVASSEVYPTWANENNPTGQSNRLPTQKFHSIVIFCSPVSVSFGLTITRWTNSTTSSRVRYETCASSRTRCICVWTPPVSSCCCSSSVSNVSIRISAFFTSSRKVWFISEN